MSEWYYADAANARQGPVAAVELVRLRLQGSLSWDTLVWRDGMADWRPMREFAGDLAQVDDRGPLLATGTGGVVDAGAASAPAPEPASPYAPPASSISTATVVHGGEVVYAGFWKRFAAMVIDGFAAGVASWIVQIPLLIAAGATGVLGGEALAGGSIGFFVLAYSTSILIPWLYFSWMHASGSQATLGKMAVGIKVTRGSGERISFGRSFARYAAYFFVSLLTLGIGVLVSAFTTALTERRQALHDMICDTLVVDRHAFTDRPDLQRRELGAVTWVIIVIGGGLLALALLGIVAAIAIPALSS